MKQLIFKVVITLMAYFTIGYIIIFLFDYNMENKWTYIALWTLVMTVAHLFIIVPLGKKLNQGR